MKIGIITITEGTNIGNRLQNYAVQEFLKKQGDIKPETIKNYGSSKILKREIWLKLSKIKKIIKIIIGKNRKENYYFLKRQKSFKKFNKQYINYSKYKISNTDIDKNINMSYNYFICGSDQIWNSNFPENAYVNFLQFADKEKRIAFAPSFATNTINENMIENYTKWLKEIPHLSVREDRGKEIIKELTGRDDVEVLVDPTMLLIEEDWSKIAKRPQQLKNDKFILNYFLGELSEKRKNEINKIAKENGCEVINIMDKNSPYYSLGPSEFLYLEKNAFLVCTDSFHSSVFAILFGRPFIVFDREDSWAKMNSRLETLLKKFELEDRWYKDKITKELLEVDYSNTYKILEEERKKAKDFFNKEMNYCEGL